MKRSKFIIWGAAILGSMGLIKSLKLNSFKIRVRNTKRYLTQDGKLVEVDLDRVNKTGKKLSLTELKNWVSK